MVSQLIEPQYVELVRLLMYFFGKEQNIQQTGYILLIMLIM